MTEPMYVLSPGERVIRILMDRGGFSEWWDDIHEDDKREIRGEINEELPVVVNRIVHRCELEDGESKS